MLKRLLIATLVVGLTFSLGTSVLADNPGTLNQESVVPVFKGDPNHPKLDQVTRANEIPVANRTVPTDEGIVEITGSTPVKPSVPAPFCDNLSYYAGTLGFFWGLPSAFWGDFGTRFTTPAGIACTVQVAWVLLYGDVMSGDPDLSVTIYDDNGFGQPGTALETVIVPNAALPTVIDWVGVAFTIPHVFGEYGSDVNYFVVYDAVVDDTLDFLGMLSGDGTDNPYDGEGRSGGYRFSAGQWMSFLGQYGPGSDYDLIQDVDRCCYDLPFTDCNFQAWHGGAYYIWSTPHPTYGDSEWSTRFSVSGPETLKSVRVSVYDRSATAPPPYIAGDDDLIIRVYDDDGSGYPGTLLHTETVTGGTYPFYPAWTDVPMSVPLVFEDDFHVSFGTSSPFGSGDYEVLMGDDGATGNGDGIGGSLRTFGAGDPGYAADCGHPVWYEMTCWWGLDAGFFIEAEMCKDQFAVCESQFWTAGITSVLLVPDSNPLVEWAQRFMSSGADCRVDELEIVLYRHPVDVGVRPLMYTHDTWINIYTDAGGVPGSLINTYVLTPADYAAAGYTGDPFTGFLIFTIPTNDVIGGTSFWVGVQPQTAIPAEGIRVVADNDGGGGNVLGTVVDLGGGGNWLDVAGGFGWASDAAMEMTAKICCIPFDEQDCAALLPDPNWNNLNHDQARTGRSGNELGDAWCDLNLVWNYQSPTDRTWYTGATIYNGKVACSFGDHYVVFDLVTGASQYVLSGVPALDPTPEELGNTLRCAPFITSVASLGGIDVMFVGGGSEQSIYAYNFATGAMIWKRSFLSVGLAQLYGTTRYVPFLYYENLDGLGTDVVIWVTDNGRIVAADAATGTRFRTADGYVNGWATVPVILGSGVSTAKTGATDGTSMFFGTSPGTSDGDVYSVDAATGAINWSLSTSGGLQAVALWTAFGGIDGPVPALEQFNSGIAYDGLRLYFTSYLGQGEHPSEGAFYRVNASDGSLVGGSATLARPGIWFLNAGAPVIDVNRVYLPGLSRWAVSPTEQLAAYAKATGASLWQLGGPTNGGHRADIALTCEPDGAPDLLLVFDDEGFFRVVSSVDGNEIFRRRVHSPGGGANDIGMSIAVGTDGDGDEWVVASDFYGTLMAMEKQEGMDRPRLEILTYRPQVPVEFGTNTAFVVSLGQVLTNTGCTDLTVSNLIVDENPPADVSIIPNFSAQIVDPSVAFRAATLADMLTDNSFENVKNAKLNSVDEIDLSRDKNREVASSNKAAAAPPAWFVSISTSLGLPAVIAPGDTAEILVTADQTQITRGPLPIYITVVSDDPDFFMNGIAEPSNVPVINATIVGGCLLDTTTLLFGAGGANIQWVTNAGRIGTGDWTPHAIEVDGESNYVFQGTYIFGVSPFRIAINTQDWGSGGEESSWISWQPDPNYCDDLCEPTATAAVLGMITTNGLSYTAIDGHIVCKSGVDSVQNFDDGSGGWDWTIYTAPFDNDSSMGLYINSRVAGADDGTPLTTNMTVEIFEFIERNGQAVPGWKFGAHIDCDILVDAGGDHDTVWIDRTISTAWASAYPATSHAFGWIKLPFGCVDGWDSNPIKNVVGLDSDQGLFEDTLKYDSFYFFMSQPPGATYGQTMAAAAQDQQFLTTIIEHDFTPNEVLEFGVAMFAHGNLTNAHSSAELVDQALFANKWVGFGRGDVNDDNAVNLGDIMHLAYYLADTGTNPGPIPFMHLGDVNADGNVDALDLDYLTAYYFDCGPCPTGDWIF